MLYDARGDAIPPPGMGFVPSRPSRPVPELTPGETAVAIADREIEDDE